MATAAAAAHNEYPMEYLFVGLRRRSFHAINRSTRVFTHPAGLWTRAVVNSADGWSEARRDNLMTAAARSNASETLETAPSSAAISVASLQALSRSVIPGKDTNRSVSFLRL